MKLQNKLSLHSILATGLCLLFFSGCVFRRAAFTHATTLLKMRIDSAFKLTEMQSQTVSRTLDDFLNELNKNELRALQALVSSAGAQFSPNTTQKQVEAIFTQWDDIYARATLRAAPAVADFLYKLEEHQIQHLRTFLTKRNEKKKERLTQGELKFTEQRVEKLKTQVSDWIGPLHQAQQDAVREFASGEFRRAVVEEAASFRSHSIFLKALSEKLSKEAISNVFTGQQVTPFKDLDPLHEQVKQERRKGWIALVTRIAQTLSVKQKERFKKETESLALDLMLIGQEPESE